MSTNIPDDSVSKSQAATPGYKPQIENHTQELKKLDERIRKEFEKRSEERGEKALRIESNPEILDSIKSRPAGEILKRANVTFTPEMKADMDAGMTAGEFFEKYKDSIIKDMGL